MKFSSYIKVRNGKPYFRMAVPADVRRLLVDEGPKEICFRLPTDSVGDANRAAAELAEHCAVEFDAVRRRLRPAAPQPLTDRAVKALQPLIEITTKRAVLLQDDRLRDHDIAQVNQLLSFSAEHHLRPPTTSAQFVEQSRAFIDERVAQMAQDPMASPAAGIAEIIVGATLGDRNFELDEASDETKELLRVAREAVLSAYRDLQVRYHGIAVPTPAESEVDAVIAQTGGKSAAPPSGKSVPSLEDIFQLWKSIRGRSNPKTADTFRATMCALARFVHPETRVMDLSACKATEITDRVLQRFIDHLLSEPVRRGQPRTPQTVSFKLAHLKAMFRLAKSKFLLHDDPTCDRRVEMPRNPPPPRVSFTPANERHILTHSLFTSRELPEDGKAGRAAAFWIPLLMWKGGMRPNELCQAAASNVKVIQLATTQIVYLDINNEDGRRTKCRSSNRLVPIHDDLIALGFLDYWRALPQDGFLFPDLQPDSYGRSENFSKWFNKKFLRGVLGVQGPKEVLYSFRHGFIEKCRNAEMADSTRVSLVGHEGGSPVDDAYGGEVCIGTKHAALMRVSFEHYPIAHW